MQKDSMNQSSIQLLSALCFHPHCLRGFVGISVSRFRVAIADI